MAELNEDDFASGVRTLTRAGMAAAVAVRQAEKGNVGWGRTRHAVSAGAEVHMALEQASKVASDPNPDSDINYMSDMNNADHS